jgi:hypothetical protein
LTILEVSVGRWFRPRLYTVTRDGAAMATIGFGRTYQNAEIVLGPSRCAAGSDGMRGGKFHLDCNGTRLATAERSGFRRGLKVQTGSRTLTLKPRSIFGRGFIIVESDNPIGSIAPRGWFSSKCRADLPDDLAPEIQVFLIWLVLLIWWRMAFATTLTAVSTTPFSGGS